MKQIKIIIPILISILIIATSCYKDRDTDLGSPVAGLSGSSSGGNTVINRWLYDSLVKPWNIEIIYSFDRVQTGLKHTYVPIREDKVIDLMTCIKQLWIKTYVDAVGADFMKTYGAKQFILSGSLQYEVDGSAILGVAEGGKKIYLFGQNEFIAKDRDKATDIMGLLFHEFTHILNQHINYPYAYKLLTVGNYTPRWINYSTEIAYSLGFASQYARANDAEDVAVTTTLYVTLGKQGFDDFLSGVAVKYPTGAALIRQKKDILLSYYKQSFGLDLDILYAAGQANLKAYLL